MTTATKKRKVRKTYVQSMISLDIIRSFHPCSEGWRVLVEGLQHKRGFADLPGDKLFPLSWVREINGNHDFRWLVSELKFAEGLDPEQRRRLDAMYLALWPDEVDGYDCYSVEAYAMAHRRETAGKWGDYAEMTACLAICDGKVAA